MDFAPDIYTIASGGRLDEGRNPPSGGGSAAWAANAQVLVPLLIPGSSGFGGTTGLSDYGGLDVVQSTGEIVAALNGGHGGTTDNRVIGIPLMADSPAWVIRHQPTPSGQVQYDAPYNSDGLPAARHMYDTLHVVEELNGFIIAGGSGYSGNAITSGTTNFFHLDTNTWDAAGVWPSTDGNAGYGFDPSRATVWTNSGQRYNVLTKTKDYPSGVQAGLNNNPNGCRWPLIYVPTKDIMFGLYWGTNWSGSGRALTATAFKADGTGPLRTISFNSSAAYTQFLADGAAAKDISGNPATLFGACMVYDQFNDCLWWYVGTGGTAGGAWSTTGHLYKIKPNLTDTWDMELIQVSLPQTYSSGLNGNMKYVNKLKGIVLAPKTPTTLDASGDLYLIRTA